MNELEDLDEVVAFALEYQGHGWGISSINVYRYKDTGEWLWSVNMGSNNRIGERSVRLNITKENGAFQARLVESTKWPGPFPRRYRKKDGQVAYMLPSGRIYIEPNTSN